MTNFDAQSRLAALAALPPKHPAREQFHAELAALEPVERDRWLLILRESDLLHEGFSSGPAMPASLTAKLLAVPAAVPVKRTLPYKRLLAYAACILVAVPVAMFLLNRGPEGPSTHIPVVIAAQTATDIADLAIKIHLSPPPLAIASSDPDAVAAALKDSKMPFPTILMKPTQPLTLLGGGVCDFGPTRAIFTRWKSTGANAVTYTLYQFDGSPFQVPANFQRETVAPSSSTQTMRVSLWPGYGNPCTWALVLEDPQAAAPFYY